MVIRGKQRSLRQAALAWARACLVVGLPAAAPVSQAQAQGQDACIYANQNYSHGAIFGGTRCNRGSWINLSETEFRRLYPNGLGSEGAAAAQPGPPAAPAGPATPAAPGEPPADEAPAPPAGG